MEDIPPYLGPILVLAPFVLFVISMIIISVALVMQGLKLSDMLKESPNSHNLGSHDSNDPNPKFSTSRVVLFLSGVTSLILGVCFASFYFYMHIYNPVYVEDMDFSSFSTLLVALGIGVIPYGVNQLKRIRL